MSANLATICQSPEAAIRFLRHLPSADGSSNIVYVTDASMSAFLDAATVIGKIAISDSSPATSEMAPSSFSSLLRDTGRKVTIVGTGTGNPIREVWIAGQRVRGAGTEGVPADYATTGAVWVRIFADSVTDGHNVEWARIG